MPIVHYHLALSRAILHYTYLPVSDSCLPSHVCIYIYVCILYIIYRYMSIHDCSIYVSTKPRMRHMVVPYHRHPVGPEHTETCWSCQGIFRLADQRLAAWHLQGQLSSFEHWMIENMRDCREKRKTKVKFWSEHERLKRRWTTITNVSLMFAFLETTKAVWMFPGIVWQDFSEFSGGLGNTPLLY